MLARRPDDDERNFEQTAAGEYGVIQLPPGPVGTGWNRHARRGESPGVPVRGSGERAHIPLAGRSHAGEQVVERLALVLAERRQQLLRPQRHRFPRTRELRLPGAGQVDRVAAAIVRVAPALHEPLGLEVVDHAHEAARVEAQLAAELLLRAPLRKVGQIHQREVLRPHSERLERVHEQARLSAPEAEQQVADARLEWRAAFDAAADHAAILTGPQNTTVRLPKTSTRSSRCAFTARARTVRSISAPRPTSVSVLSRWVTRVTSCSMIGPASSSSVT